MAGIPRGRFRSIAIGVFAATLSVVLSHHEIVSAQRPTHWQRLTRPSPPPPKQPIALDQFVLHQPTSFVAHRPGDEGEFLIDQDNVTFDFLNSKLIGASDRNPADQYVGRAIIIRKAKNVTLKNVNIRGFKVAIYAEDSPGLRLENCDVSLNYRMRLKSTPQREHYDDWLWPHKNDNGEWLKYGAGIYLVRCDDAKIINCRARNGQNGICISRSDRVEIKGNDMSFMSGWGLAMHRSNHCRVTGNIFNYCVRGYSHGVYNRGQDSAGILVFEQCSDNIFAFNSATHGGDGFFLYAGDETLKVTGTGGCNRNVIYKNDFSHAVTNGIEATFSDSNVIVGNTLAHCDHGVWAGYSTKSLIAQNHFAHCKIGIAIEHGRKNRMEWNDFVECHRGIWLWWDEDKDLIESPYAKKNGHASNYESIDKNYFRKCTEGVVIDHSTNANFTYNLWSQCATTIRLNGDCRSAGCCGNSFAGGIIENNTADGLWGGFNDVDETCKKIGMMNLHIVDEYICGDSRPPTKPVRVESLALEKSVPDPPIPASTKAAPATKPRSSFPQPGLDTIFIDEWGPYDFIEPRLFPAWCTGSPPITINVLGPPSATYKVLPGIDPHFEASPQAGDAPGKLSITARTGEHAPAPGIYPLELNVRIGKSEQQLICNVIVAKWTVRYFTWMPALDPLAGDENWKKIISAAPLHTEERDNLDLPFGGGGPTPEVKERFALIADTRLTLPAGKWRLRTISDDGIRVYFDNKRVIDNWTWHVPAEDAAVVEATAAGPHDIRVEYFEITGHAQLQVFLEPAN